MTDAAAVLFRRSYQQRVLSVASDALIGYWPQTEPSGATAFDIAGSRRNGAYTGVDLNYPGIGDGGAAPLWDGTNDYCNIYSASLAGAFNGNEGTLHLWIRVASSGVWTDATQRQVAILQADGTNRYLLRKATTTNLFTFTSTVGGTAKTVTATIGPTLDWVPIALTWSKTADAFKAYVNGVQSGATQTALGTYVGTLASTTAILGAVSLTPTQVWSGYLAHPAIWTRALSAGEVAELYRVN